MPDRNSFYGFTDLPTVRERGTVVLTHGEGPYVIDVHGRRYLDANSGLWNMVAGFDHPGLTEAAKAQYDTFPGYHAFFGRMADTTVMLSEKMVEVSPFERGKVFYTNSGSEANDTMVKMLWMLARAEGKPERRKILTRFNAYHGVTAVAASMTGKPYNETFGLPLPGFLHLTCPHYWREGKPGESEEAFTQHLADELEEVIAREGADTIAGFFAEPVMGAGGVIPPSKGYFQAIQPILRKHDIPLISDEVICGFGRTGEVWGAETYGFMPDAIIASKAMTAGFFPMGAVILGPEMTDRLQAAVDAIEEFPHGFTGSGHPVGSAIALKAIDVILNEGLLENVRTLTPKFEAGLAELASHSQYRRGARERPDGCPRGGSGQGHEGPLPRRSERLGADCECLHGSRPDLPPARSVGRPVSAVHHDGGATGRDVLETLGRAQHGIQGSGVIGSRWKTRI